jgi:hypothetical protein
MAVIDGVLEELTPRSRMTDLAHLRAALRTVECGISNLAQAIAAAGDLDPLLHELRVARARRDELKNRLAGIEGGDVQRFDRSALERTIRPHLHTWRSLLSTSHVQDGRRLLREALAGPLRFRPEGRTVSI